LSQIKFVLFGKVEINPSAELFGATDVLYMSIFSSGKELFNNNFSMQNSVFMI